MFYVWAILSSFLPAMKFYFSCSERVGDIHVTKFSFNEFIDNLFYRNGIEMKITGSTVPKKGEY
jgi:hypothetical protein